MIPSTTWAIDQEDPAFVGVWLFDEGAGAAVEDLKNGNDGSINGAFTWAAGMFGGAIVAGGGGSIDVPDSPSIASIRDGLTVAAWFRIDADSDTGVRKQGAFLLEDQSGVEPIPDGFSFRIWTDQGLSPGLYGKTELVIGQWYHVAGTYDGATMELYIDGEPESSFGALDAVGADWVPTWGGAINPGGPLQLKFGPESLTGAMDEVMILNRALGVDEIRQLLQGWDNLASDRRFEITAFSYDEGAQTVDVTFTSSPGVEYAIDASTDGIDWTEVLDASVIGAAAATTTVSGLPLPPPSRDKLLVRVRRIGAP